MNATVARYSWDRAAESVVEAIDKILAERPPLVQPTTEEIPSTGLAICRELREAAV